MPVPSATLARRPLRPIETMGLRELERIRLVLRGGSSIDWWRTHFLSRDEVDRFLKLYELDMADPADEAWARWVLADAVDYLRRTFKLRSAEAIAHPEEIHDVFLFASGAKGTPRLQKIACIVLKLMHVIQHIEGREQFYWLTASEAEHAAAVTRKILDLGDAMRADGMPIVELAHSNKTRDSLVTKLIAKKDTIAAQVYDKTRFRIVTERREDVLPVLVHLTDHLFPFHQVIPGQTENSLIAFDELLKEYPNFGTLEPSLQFDQDYETLAERERNQFSGTSYRVLNFVVDVPLRLDPFLPAPDEDRRPRKGPVGFVLVEFQLLDRETAEANESGENAHERYKRRQRRRVLNRLSRGLSRKSGPSDPGTDPETEPRF